MVALHAVSSRRRVAGTLVVLTLLAAVVPLGSPTVDAGSTQVVTGLPQALARTAAATDGGMIWIFGGCTGFACNVQVPDITRYDPGPNQVFPAGALPSGRSGVAVAHSSGFFWVFGGWNGASAMTQVVQVQLPSGMLQVLPVTLPSPRHGMAAFSDGYFVYLVGGCSDASCDVQSNQILRFDPSIQAFLTVANLPFALGRTAAVWDGQAAYFFGGRSGTGTSADVLQWMPGMVTAQPVTTLPGARHSSSAAILNGKAFVYGGSGSSVTSEIVQYQLPGLQGSIPTEILPLALSGTSAVAVGSAAYVFGGCYDVSCGGQSRDIIRHQSNSPPFASIYPIEPRPCVDGGADVTVDGSGSYDPDNDPLQFFWSGFTSDGQNLPYGSSPTYTYFFPPGDSYVQLQVSDGEFASSTATGVYVYDYEPPVVSSVRPAPGNAYVMDTEIAHGVTGADAELGPLTASADAIPIAVGRLTVRVDATDSCAMAGVFFAPFNQPGSFDATPPYEMVLNPAAGTAENVTVDYFALDEYGYVSQGRIRFYHVGADTQPVKDACLLVFSPTVCGFIP